MRNIVYGLACLGLVSAAGEMNVGRAAQPAPRAGAAAGEASLAVTVTYKGKGTVAAANEIAVFLFDTPDINEQSMPLGVEVLHKNGGTAVFRNISAPTVYIAAVYDEKGVYDEEGPPPSGTPTAIHADQAGAPIPVKTGKSAKVSVTFDDSRRMP